MTGQSFKFLELNELNRFFGHGLRVKYNLKKGEVIAMFLPNCPEYIIGLLGAAGIGALVTTANPSYTAFELSRQLNIAKAKIVLTTAASLNNVHQALKEINKSMFNYKLLLKPSPYPSNSIHILFFR